MNRPWYLVVCVACAGQGAAASPPLERAPTAPVQVGDARDAAVDEKPGVIAFGRGRELLEREGFRGTFLVRRVGERDLLATDPVLMNARYLPASTFKIPNAMFALETGVAKDEALVLPWDGKPGYMDSWNRDHDLRSAMEHSVVWYFQEVARRIGRDRMQQLVHDVRYGNEEVGERVDTFWLEGPLAISPKEQLEFVERFIAGDMPIARKHVATVRGIVPVREVGADTLHAKTGTAVREEPGHAWLVGWTERGGQPTACFAMLLLGEREHGVERLVARRWELGVELLAAAGVVGD